MSNVCVGGAAGSVCVSNVCVLWCCRECVCTASGFLRCQNLLLLICVRVSPSLHDACTQQMVQMSYYWTNFKYKSI